MLLGKFDLTPFHGLRDFFKAGAVVFAGRRILFVVEFGG